MNNELSEKEVDRIASRLAFKLKEIAEQGFLDPQELSTKIGIPQSTVYRKIKTKDPDFPEHYKFKKLYRFKKEEVEAWIESKKQNNASGTGEQKCTCTHKNKTKSGTEKEKIGLSYR